MPLKSPLPQGSSRSISKLSLFCSSPTPNQLLPKAAFRSSQSWGLPPHNSWALFLVSLSFYGHFGGEASRDQDE